MRLYEKHSFKLRENDTGDHHSIQSHDLDKDVFINNQTGMNA